MDGRETGVNAIGAKKWRYMMACLFFQVGMLLSVVPVYAAPSPTGIEGMPDTHARDTHAPVTYATPAMAAMPGVHPSSPQCHHHQPCDTHQSCKHGDAGCCLSGPACMTGWAVTPGFVPLMQARADTVTFGSRYAIGAGGVASAPALPPPRKTV
ncbi:hypothetical protein GXY_09694 [Novacetimonas hansenii ATCC 23769]|uniref:Uncharacterized protein n=1 Tax=Novacetimonas hansenii ATCC 23769 TaxID=714995 RepID=D5QFL9_NOVHA|nr:hypothetical protein GXY_09694 [Novacetimonas hansenii ATCC 23769]